MKALLVLEDEDKIKLLKESLTTKGYDTICYNWILKALDNIEEISPHIVIINAEEYPRHWKTFVQYVNTYLPKNDIDIYLLANNLSENEQNKIKILGIKDVLYNISEDMSKIPNIIEHENSNSATKDLNSEEDFILKKELQPTEKELTEKYYSAFETPVIKLDFSQKEKQKKIVSSCTFSITTPALNRVIFGNVKKYKYPTIIFIPNKKEDIQYLRFGQVFENCTLKQVVDNKELSSSHRCQIRGISENAVEFCLLR